MNFLSYTRTLRGKMLLWRRHIIPLDVQVTSMGGVATTMLLNFLNQHCRANHENNFDLLKHAGSPPVKKLQRHAIYIFGCPKDATLSVFRRNLQLFHSIGMETSKGRFRGTLDEYIENQQDFFGFEEQLRNWMEKPVCQPTLLVRGSQIWDNLDQVFGYLGRNELIRLFPAKRDRVSRQTDLAPKKLELLARLYDPLSRYIEALPDVILRHP